MDRAEEVALAGVSEGLAPHAGSLLGHDLSADGEAAVFGSGLEERLHTRVHRVEAVDGVVVL